MPSFVGDFRRNLYQGCHKAADNGAKAGIQAFVESPHFGRECENKTVEIAHRFRAPP
jgi:hypothetical protein